MNRRVFRNLSCTMALALVLGGALLVPNVDAAEVGTDPSIVVTFSPESVMIGTSTTAIATVTDESGQPISGAAVNFEWTGSASSSTSLDSDIIFWPQTTTSFDGQARMPLLDVVAETVTVTATVGTVSGSAELTFLPTPAPDVSQSTFSVEGPSITATIKDAEGTSLPLQDVLFIVPDTVQVWTFCAPTFCETSPEGTVRTNSTGLALARLVSPDDSAVPVQVMVDVDGVPQPLSGSPVLVVPTPSAQSLPDPSRITVGSLSLSDSSVAKGSSVTATAVVTDGYGHPVGAGVNVTFSVSGSATVSANGSPAGAQSVEVATDATGHASATVSDATEEAVSVTAMFTDSHQQMWASPSEIQFMTYEVGSTPPSSASLEVSNSSSYFGDTVEATVTVVDSLGSPVTDGVKVAFTVSGSAVVSVDADMTSAAQSVQTVTDENGQATVMVSDGIGDLVSVTAILPDWDADGVRVEGSPAEVQFLNRNPVASSQSSLSVDQVMADVGQSITATLVAKDSRGSMLADVVISVRSTGDGQVSTDQCTTGNGIDGTTLGTCQVTVTDATAESISLEATVMVGDEPLEISGSPVVLTFVDETDPDNSDGNPGTPSRVKAPGAPDDSDTPDPQDNSATPDPQDNSNTPNSTHTPDNSTTSDPTDTSSTPNTSATPSSTTAPSTSATPSSTTAPSTSMTPSSAPVTAVTALSAATTPVVTTGGSVSHGLVLGLVAMVGLLAAGLSVLVRRQST